MMTLTDDNVKSILSPYRNTGTEEQKLGHMVSSKL